MQEEKRVRIRSVPSLTLVDVKAITREKMTIAGVRMCEKVVHLKAHGGYELHRLCHLGRSEDEERQEEAADTMTAATEWRIRKEQEAKDRAEWERAMVRARCDDKMKTQDKAPKFLRQAVTIETDDNKKGR
ncbi:hypothetical protein KC19_3G127300 [Ceratodon purpureus]|uniref:Uncharacterized protein n=1 Tax=Ceratodon purpureus TaxID=3225 RepID=A0A8T0IKE4_CERPU|nr:hypothetical protein KC19_3G127300 [Ceratodon purpureus]